MNTTKLFYQWKYIEKNFRLLGWQWKKIIIEIFNLKTKKRSKIFNKK